MYMQVCVHLQKTIKTRLIKIASSPLSYELFMAKPLLNIGRVISERDTREINIQDIFMEIYSFFSERKDYRTIKDVEKLMRYLDKRFNLPYDDELSNDELIEGRLEELGDEFKGIMEEYKDTIEGSLENPKQDEFMMDWIYNITTCVDAFIEALETFDTSINRIQVKARRIRENLLDQFINLVKGFFLVFYRVVEQYYMIINDIEMDVEKEKEYLLNDIVYMQNIHRQFIYYIEKY